MIGPEQPGERIAIHLGSAFPTELLTNEAHSSLADFTRTRAIVHQLERMRRKFVRSITDKGMHAIREANNRRSTRRV